MRMQNKKNEKTKMSENSWERRKGTEVVIEFRNRFSESLDFIWENRAVVGLAIYMNPQGFCTSNWITI